MGVPNREAAISAGNAWFGRQTCAARGVASARSAVGESSAPRRARTAPTADDFRKGMRRFVL
jgi:hypothetical protein